MDILTTTKTIKMHTVRLDDTEVERYMSDHEAWIDLLSTLLTAKPATLNGDGPARKKIARRKTRTVKHPEKLGEIIACPKCGMRVKSRGLLLHQRGSKCRARSNYLPADD